MLSSEGSKSATKGEAADTYKPERRAYNVYLRLGCDFIHIAPVRAALDSHGLLVLRQRNLVQLAQIDDDPSVRARPGRRMSTATLDGDLDWWILRSRVREDRGYIFVHNGLHNVLRRERGQFRIPFESRIVRLPSIGGEDLALYLQVVHFFNTSSVVDLSKA